jgi:hypothetical protein
VAGALLAEPIGRLRAITFPEELSVPFKAAASRLLKKSEIL